MYQSFLKLTPWNVDTISHDKLTRTIINKDPIKKSAGELTVEERAERYVGLIELTFLPN